MDIPAVLVHLCPDSEWSLNGDEYSGLEWLSNDHRPTLIECENAWKDIEHDYLMSPIRSERNTLLSSSDWTQVPDAPVDAVLWAAYRQELRDMPITITDPTEDIVWPTPPSN
jgi:hypothetical protein